MGLKRGLNSSLLCGRNHGRDRVGQQGESHVTEKPEESLEARLKQLGEKIESKRPSEPDGAEARAAESRKGYAAAMKLSSEFIAGIVVGAFLGYLLDHFAGTGPWGMIIFLLLGFCAGVLNVLRSAGMVATLDSVKRSSGNDKTDGDDA
ncbi:F0F1 ATP synthase subunit I [Ensifer sp. NM-2]|jgi:ATP synthase protein I|nr:AtpZ/AtpI family protein [Ensifer canadensis]NOV15353.1 F0F1 ATP synthase subunit I [Ensifer canadensis]PSS67161.1 F0F1 ATP synthase subunit I [Ensifer sp. NM-2]